MVYIVLLYLIYISKKLIISALYFALYVVLLGINLINKNHDLMGLLLLTVYAGGVLVLLVFILLLLNEGIVYYNEINIWIFLLIGYLIEENFIYYTLEIINYNLSDLLFMEKPLLSYFLLFLLLFSLRIIKGFFL